MYLYTIPYQDKYIIYKPLHRLAFIGNRSLADFCQRVSQNPTPPISKKEQEAYDFLLSLYFFEEEVALPDPSSCRDTYKPTVCVLFLTNSCNLRCIYCYAHGGDDAPVTMSFELARAAIDKVCQNCLDLREDHFTLCFHGGGEPTMAWSLLMDSVLYARQKELPVNINLTSNGVWTDKQRIWILENIDEISLSFDGLPEVQNQQRPRRNGSASHSSVMKTIRELDRCEKTYGIRVTITDNIIDHLPVTVEFICKNSHAKAIQVEPAFDHGRAKENKLALQENEYFAQEFIEGYDIACKHNVHMYYSGSRPWLLTNRFCEAFDKALIVGSDGFITSCYEVCSKEHELAGEFIFGCMDSKGTLTLDNGIRKNFFDRIEERRHFCKGCFCYFHCAGDCPSKTLTPEKDGHLKYNSRCELNRTITQELIIRYLIEGQGVWRGWRQEELQIVEPLK